MQNKKRATKLDKVNNNNEGLKLKGLIKDLSRKTYTNTVVMAEHTKENIRLSKLDRVGVTYGKYVVKKKKNKPIKSIKELYKHCRKFIVRSDSGEDTFAASQAIPTETLAFKPMFFEADGGINIHEIEPSNVISLLWLFQRGLLTVELTPEQDKMGYKCLEYAK